MSEIADTVRWIADGAKQAAAGQLVRIKPPSDRACATCPWRLANQADPPQRPDATPDFYYDAEARQVMWQEWEPGRGVGDGCRFGCHRNTTATHGQWCAGADGILQRQLLRWWMAGRSRTTFPGLSGPAAVLQITAAIMGRTVHTGNEQDRLYVIADGVNLEPDGDQIQVTFDGIPLTLQTVARLAHPAVLDPDLGTEQAPPLTEQERTEMTALGVGSEWASGPRSGVTILAGAD